MAISIFPSTAAEFVSNNFVVDMNDTSNNTADTGGVKQAGPYSMSFSSGDSSFDVYLIDEDGNSVGYSNNTSIVASGLFSTVVILGVAQDEIISFLYQGSVNNADGEGDEPGAGAYLESISPSDLPSIDDTATVTGGNFGADTEIKFESGATVLDAKNITVNNSTELIITRPDNLDADLDPWTLRAVNPGVSQPTGSNANLLVDEVTAGALPVWVTTSPLPTATIGSAYSETLEATDADGAVTYAVTIGSLPTGLSLDSATGAISGTATGGGQTFTVTATDDGGNTSTREFTLLVAAATGGTILAGPNGTILHIFEESGTFETFASLTDVEYLVIAGGGGAASGNTGGGGGAGGYRSSVVGQSSGGGASAETRLSFASGVTETVTIGAGGSSESQGSSTTFASITSVGGGFGILSQNGGDGGSGGGVAAIGNSPQGGNGTANQGFDAGNVNSGGGGAGAASVDNNVDGGVGVESNITGTPTYRAGGGASRTDSGNLGTPGLGAENAGGGGTAFTNKVGQNGIVIVRYSI